MASQHGLVRRRQALEAGLLPREVQQLLKNREWVPVRAGVYALADVWDGLDDWVERPRLRALAASLNMRRDHVLSHDSSADLQRLPILRPVPDLVHVTRDRVGGSRTSSGVKHHSARFEAEQVVVVDGVQALDLARTAVDIAREHGLDSGVAACDSALRMGVSRTDLARAAEPMRNWPGKRDVDRSLELADPGADSVAESITRNLVHESGIGWPETQFELSDGTRTYRADLRVGRHLIEFDGRRKYVAQAAGGLAEDPVEAVWGEKRRQDWFHDLRLGMSRVVWSDLWGVRRRQTALRIRRDHARTVAMFGESIQDLEPYIVRR